MGKEPEAMYQDKFKDFFEVLFRAPEEGQEEFSGWKPLNFPTQQTWQLSKNVLVLEELARSSVSSAIVVRSSRISVLSQMKEVKYVEHVLLNNNPMLNGCVFIKTCLTQQN